MESSRFTGQFRMLNGQLFDFQNPHTAKYDIELVATMLGKKCRFGDHIQRHYSVAEHCYHASNIYVRNPKGALMHDAPEFVMGDLVTPLKRHVGGFKEIEDNILRDMELRFKFVTPDEMTFKLVDTLLFHQEEVALNPDVVPTYDIMVDFKFWDAQTATRMFLDRYYALSQNMDTDIIPAPSHP